MMYGTRRLVVLAAVVGALALVGCGSDNPAGPSGASGVSVSGVLLGEGASVSASSVHASAASGGEITVEVEGQPISTTISGNGTFLLEDVPAGTFTLVFLQDGTEIGRVTITADAGVQVKIVVQKKGVKVVLVDLEIDDGSDSNANDSCPIEGGRVGSSIELEGHVASLTAGGFEMTVNGNRVHATNGFVLTVNAGSNALTCNGKKNATCQLGVNDQVHVRGSLTECDAGSAAVTATEVKVQKSGNGS
jgi:hypothetical protein